MPDTLHADTYEADVSFLYEPYTQRRIRIRLDDRMYEIKLDPDANWVWHSFRAFAIVEKQLAATGHQPRSFAAIGTGSGVDAIGAAHIFKHLRRVTVTDMDAAMLERAASNVRANIDRDVEVEPLAGDVCLPLTAAGRQVDILYANLPNIPVMAAAEAIIDRGTYYRPVEGATDDPVLNGFLLGLQYRFLTSAPAALAPGGFALVMLGGRFPYRIFDRLAAAAGFQFREVLCGLKRQTEAQNVLSGYAAAEIDGVEFDFYDFDQARRTLRGDEKLPGRELKTALAPWRLSARDALKEFHAGKNIGHTFHLLKATPLP